jgi:outer membrane protein TolC
MRLRNIWLCFLMLPVIALAQVQFTGLSSMLQYADKNGAAAKQAQILPRMARQDVQLQASTLYPKVNAFASGDYYPVIASQIIPAEVVGGPAGVYQKVQFGLPYIFSAGVEASMPVVNLERWAQLSRAKAQYEQSQWSSKAALSNYHIQLIQAYYQVLVTREVLKLNDENRAVADELLRIMEERNKAGVINPADYNRSVNLQLDVRASGINYSKALQQALNNLQALLSAKESVTINDTLGKFSWPIVQAPADISVRAAWQEAAMKQRVAELSLSEAKKGAMPRLALNARYAYNMQSKLDGNSGNVEFDVANVGLRFELPISQGNYYRAMRRKSRMQLDYAKLDVERTNASLTQQHGDWFQQYSAAYNRRDVVGDKVATTSDNLRIARLNLKEGVMEFDEFNNIFMEYNRARMDQLQNLADGILYNLLSTQKF